MKCFPEYLFILLVALTACGRGGGEFEQERTTDYLLEREVADQKESLHHTVPGNFVDGLEWQQDGERVYTILSENATPLQQVDTGIYLTHYSIGIEGPRRRWQYVDVINCEDAPYFLTHVNSLRDALRSTTEGDYFLLAYALDCPVASDRNTHVPLQLALVDTKTGVPASTINSNRTGSAPVLTEAHASQRLLLREWARLHTDL